MKKEKLKQKIKYQNKFYNIIDTFKASDFEGFNSWIVYETDELKTKKFWAWYPLYVKGKFKFFTMVEAQYRFYISRKREFSEWNYSYGWGPFKGEWRIEKILN